MVLTEVTGVARRGQSRVGGFELASVLGVDRLLHGLQGLRRQGSDYRRHVTDPLDLVVHRELEQAHSARAMLWVEAENAKTSEALERNPVFYDLFNEARLIAEAQDRIPEPSVLANQVFNFWQDAEHEHGIWRETSRPDFETLYRRPSPAPKKQ